ALDLPGGFHYVRARAEDEVVEEDGGVRVADDKLQAVTDAHRVVWRVEEEAAVLGGEGELLNQVLGQADGLRVAVGEAEGLEAAVSDDERGIGAADDGGDDGQGALVVDAEVLAVMYVAPD